MHHGVEKALGDGQTHDVQRFVPRISTTPPNTAGPTLSAWGVPPRAPRPSSQIPRAAPLKRDVPTVRSRPNRCGRRSRTRPDAAAGSDLFEDRNLDPHGFFVCLEQCHHRRGNHVVLVFGGKFLPAAVADNEPPALLRCRPPAGRPRRRASAPSHRSRNPGSPPFPGENFDISHTNLLLMNEPPLIEPAFRSGSLGRKCA